MHIGINQLAVTFGAVAYAGFALLSGLDRLAAHGAPVPAPIGWPYARNAPLYAASAARDKHQWAKATALVTRSLLADPVNETVIGTLGEIRLQAGDLAGADAAFRVSAPRGWRDTATHVYWMGQSVNAGDFATASMHADALLRTPNLNRKARDKIVDDLLDYDEGRTALAARLHLDPPWADDFAKGIDGETGDELAARADVIGRTGRGIWDCQATIDIIERLLTAGYIDQARTVHDASCAQAARPINDPRFTRFINEAQASVIDWRALRSGDVVVEGENPPEGQAKATPLLHLLVSKPSTTRVLMQGVIVPAGTYRVTWRMPGTDRTKVPALTVALDCFGDLGRSQPGTTVPGQQAAYAATLQFDGKCLVPMLAFWLAPSKDVTLADVGMVRLDQHDQGAQ